jgi:hypothetical protein
MRGRKPLLSIYPSQLLFPAGAPLALSSATLLSQNAHQFGLRENGKLFPAFCSVHLLLPQKLKES